jgi:hypothetical protein
MIEPEGYLELWHQEHRERMRAARQWIEARNATQAAAPDEPVRRAPGLVASVLQRWTNLLATLTWSAPDVVLTAECED